MRLPGTLLAPLTLLQYSGSIRVEAILSRHAFLLPSYCLHITPIQHLPNHT